MARLGEGSPARGVTHFKPGLDRETVIAAHRRSAEFHDQEIREAPHRGEDGMPEDMVAIHRRSLLANHSALAELGVVQLVTDRPERPEAEAQPVERQATVPAAAMPELIPAAA